MNTPRHASAKKRPSHKILLIILVFIILITALFLLISGVSNSIRSVNEQKLSSWGDLKENAYDNLPESREVQVERSSVSSPVENSTYTKEEERIISTVLDSPVITSYDLLGYDSQYDFDYSPREGVTYRDCLDQADYYYFKIIPSRAPGYVELIVAASAMDSSVAIVLSFLVSDEYDTYSHESVQLVSSEGGVSSSMDPTDFGEEDSITRAGYAEEGKYLVLVSTTVMTLYVMAPNLFY